jgi:hypothetical protein
VAFLPQRVHTRPERRHRDVIRPAVGTQAADRDNDGTLDAKELGSARGRALLRLLR